MEIATTAAPAGLGLPPSLFHMRRDLQDAERLIRLRTLTDLKGLSLPIHVMLESSSGMRASRTIRPHTMPKGLTQQHLTALGNGLFVLSPELTVTLHQRRRTRVEIAKMMFEACGLFSINPRTERLSLCIARLLEAGVISPDSPDWGMAAYWDSRGRRIPILDSEGKPLDWSPFFDRFGRLTDLWKRPPLATTESIALALREFPSARWAHQAERALDMTYDGAGSPAEVQANLLLCSGTWNGGESWGEPLLNKRIDFSPEQQALAGQTFCVADATWEDRKAELEVNGDAAHADRWGFRRHSGRRAALESDGYVVQEITPYQMSSLERFDAMLPEMARRLGFSLQPRTPAFLKRRDSLHSELFSIPYDPL